MEFRGKRISILGIGRSGLALSRILKKCGANIFISDEKMSKDLKALEEELVASGIRVELGGHSEEVFKDKDLIVISPGVSIYHPIIKASLKAGVPVIGEVEVAYQLAMAPIIAVTGTNGKSTTVSIIHKVLGNSGIASILAGNIGRPLLAEVYENPEAEWIVAEISSFQLETVKDFKPRIAVLLNITSDHMDRHKSMDEYIAKKSRIFENQKEEDFAVLNFDDERVRDIARKVKSRKYYFSVNNEVERGAFIFRGFIHWKNGNTRAMVLSLDDIPLVGNHNMENMLAVVSVAKLLGISNADIIRSLKSFISLPHRIEYVATVRGVDFFDDSKGTNPGAVIAALQSFDRPIVLIAGGKDKDIDFTHLGSIIVNKVKTLIVIGETANKIAAAARMYGMNDIRHACTLRDAVEKSLESAHPGDVVLLSPACASFDMFKSAEDRGDKFREIVKEMEVSYN